MAKETILIGCKLPHGLQIAHPADSTFTATIQGMKSSKIIGATFVTTEIDKELWDVWKVAYADYVPLKAGMIFEARNQTEANSKGKELEKVKTGFERLDPKAEGVRVKPASKD